MARITQTDLELTFREIHPEKRYGAKFVFKGAEKVPIKIFLKKLPVGLILVTPSIQVQFKGKKQPIKPRTLKEAKAWILNNIHLIK